MEYRNIHNGAYIPSRKEELILNEAISLMDKPANESFLMEAASLVLKHSEADYFLIGSLSDDKEHLSTLLLLKGKEQLDNITYQLKGTPCESARTYGFCYIPNQVAKEFPEDEALRALGVESYLGSYLLSSTYATLGIVALMSSKTIENAAFVEHLLLVLSPAFEEAIQRSASIV